MRNNRQPLNEKSRSKLRSSRRKTNIILNSLIVIVLLLIVIVSSKIFFGNDQNDHADTSLVKTANGLAEKDAETVGDKETDTNKENKTNSQDKESASDDGEKTDDLNNEDSNQNDQEGEEDQEIVTEGGSDPGVKKSIINPVWEPVGTSQEGQHFNAYSGVDWDEQVQAITYGTGIEESNMTILFLGNNGPNKSVGTIVQKDTGQKFRVYIEWVDEKGWKPTLVEELVN
ncbi:YrrS family protein [Bacillus sp. V3B]|uniref:YrrS family protein n=1 Tax=Bacillus sp. V3B TaxID=2804915 RepID=UPI00210B869D|nr:YrrS family protein [Bacillus sp. V3B]